MSLADLSLDDIIARQKKKKGGASRNVGNGKALKQRGRGFLKKYESDATFAKTKAVPEGKWGHDGFEELYGSRATRPVNVPVIRGGGKTFGRSILSRKVKLHITNLAPTVNTADLNELLESFPIESATVNYDELGQSVGTADVVTDRASAEEIKSNFAGVALDGQTMRMFIIDESSSEDIPVKSIRERLSLGKRPVRITRGIVKRRDSRSYSLGRAASSGRMRLKARKPGDKRKKMTDAELDKELEEYMKKGSSTQVMDS